MRLIEELLSLRLNELRRTDRLQDANQEQQIVREIDQVLQYFLSKNNLSITTSARKMAISTWTDVLTLMIEKCETSDDEKTGLILQALQILTPKLEGFVLEDDAAVTDIANAIETLIFQFQTDASAINSSYAVDFAYDRLFQVFHAALRSVSCPEVNVELREILYSICYRYSMQLCVVPGAPARQRYGTQIVKALNEKSMEIICDDALGASPSCRITAVLLLEALSTLAESNQSTYVANCLVRTNFVQILVESIESVPIELRETAANGEWQVVVSMQSRALTRIDIPLILTFYEAKLSLLLKISQSKTGAAHVMGAGMFHAIRASGLFSVDPDIGVGELGVLYLPKSKTSR